MFAMEDSDGMREVACCWRPHPFSPAPQAPCRVSQVDLYRPDKATPCAGPSSGVAPTIAGVTGWHLRPGMPGAPFPGGLCTLQVMHHGMPQPRTTSWRLVSSAWGLSGAGCSRQRVVENASPQGLIGYLSIQGVSTCFHAAFTAHSDAGAEQLS